MIQSLQRLGCHLISDCPLRGYPPRGCPPSKLVAKLVKVWSFVIRQCFTMPLIFRPSPFLCLSRSSESSSSTLLAFLQGSSEAKVLETALKNGGQVGQKCFYALPDFSFVFLLYFPGNHCRCPLAGRRRSKLGLEMPWVTSSEDRER